MQTSRLMLQKRRVELPALEAEQRLPIGAELHTDICPSPAGALGVTLQDFSRAGDPQKQPGEEIHSLFPGRCLLRGGPSACDLEQGQTPPSRLPGFD